ncbi:iron chelate uptake ABC transporter family permease subunit, partial [Klebsiella pneumoniae]
AEWFSAKGELFIWQIRLPRTLAVLLVGAALALSGAIMQALFENPLAEPGLLGVSNGAGVGLIAAVLLGKGLLPGWALGLCAIAGALVITFILLRFARRHLSTSRLLLAGVALGIICSALMTWAVYFSTSFDLRQLMYWMMGGFGGVD